jgi:hypothetical protein
MIAILRILAVDAVLRKKLKRRLVLVTRSLERAPKLKLSSKIGRNLMLIFSGK